MIPRQDLRKPIGVFHDNPYSERRYFNRRRYVSEKAIGALKTMDADETIGQSDHDKLGRVARVLSFTVGRGEPPKKQLTEEYKKTEEYKQYVPDRENPDTNNSYASDWTKAGSVALLTPTGIETWVIPGALSKPDATIIKNSSSAEELPSNIYIDKKV